MGKHNTMYVCNSLNKEIINNCFQVFIDKFLNNNKKILNMYSPRLEQQEKTVVCPVLRNQSFFLSFHFECWFARTTKSQEY